MVSLEELRDQLRDALAVFKAVMADPVPAEEVFFVRDIKGDAHVAGNCLTYGYEFHEGAQWERVGGSSLPNLVYCCPCVQRAPESLARRVEDVLNSNGPGKWARDSYWNEALFSTFPPVFAALATVDRLYAHLLVATRACWNGELLLWRGTFQFHSYRR